MSERMADSANSLTGQIAARLKAEQRANDEIEEGRVAAAENLRQQEADTIPDDEVLHYTDPRIHSKIPLNPEYF